MIYLTKPNSKIQNQADDKPQNITTETTQIENKKPLVNIKIDELKCDKEKLLKALDELRQQRDKDLKALTDKGIEAKKLSEMVRKHVRDHNLANEILPSKPKKESEKTPEQIALNNFQQKNKKVFEDIMMAAFAGDTDEYIDKFLNGGLAPLDPNSDLHKEFLLNIISMSGDEQVITSLNRLYSEEGPLNPNAAPTIIQSVTDPKLLKQLLSRIGDVNQEIDSRNYYFGHTGTKSLIQIAMQSNRYDAAQLLLDLGAKPVTQSSMAALDYIYEVTDESIPLIEALLNKGFTNSNSNKANRLAEMLSKQNSPLAARVNATAKQLKAEEAVQFANLPNEFRQIAEDYEAARKPLNTKYLECIAQENKAKPKIPPYQSIDKEKIKENIDQMVSQKLEYAQIVAILGAINKETVEYGYDYLGQLRIQNVSNKLDMTKMPKEVRTLIGLMRDENWDQMVDFLKNNKLDPSWDISPGTMIPMMIEEGAPESAIAAMAKISNKNNPSLLSQALYQTELLEQIAAYGFNLNALDQSNKNLFYQAVTRNSVDQIDILIGHGVAFTSDPYGYDALDSILRKSYINEEVFKKLGQVGFPVTEQHLDYCLYLKTYYPERYNKAIKAWPALKVDGKWEPKS